MPINPVGSILLDPANYRAGSQTGIDGQAQVGDIAIYDNVATLPNGDPVAVIITVEALSHPNLHVDLTDPGQNGVIQVNHNADTAMDGENVSLSFSFINQTTGLPVTISGTATVDDIDGNGGRQETVTIDTSEYVAYQTDMDTELLTNESGGNFTVTGTEGNSPNDQDAWFSATFEDSSVINMTFGATANRAYYGFNGAVLSNPTPHIEPEIAGDDMGTVTEAGNLDDGTVVSGTVSDTGDLGVTDTSPGATQAWTGDASGTYGDFTIDPNTGEWTYTLDNSLPATDALAEGQTVTETFTVSVTDQNGMVDVHDVVITVHGTNDSPVVTTAAGEDEGAVSEAGNLDDGTVVPGVPQATGTLSSSDVDAGATATWSIPGGGTGTYGTLVLDPNTGAWTYTLDNNDPDTDALPEGSSVTETFDVLVTDEFGAYATETVTITITGTNDSPVITTPAGGNEGTVVEDGVDADCNDVPGTPGATGTLTSSDVDTGATATWSGDADGTYGTFAIDPNTGEWTYTLDNDRPATEALASGHHAFDTFTVTVTDEFGATATQDVVIRVDGSDDNDCDDTDVTEDIWLHGVPCDHEANQLIDTQWTYHGGGSDRLTLEIEIPIEAFFGEDGPYIFEGIDVQPYVDAFTALGFVVDPSDIDINVRDEEIDVRISARGVQLTPAQVAGLPTEFETSVTVSEDGVVRQLDVCTGIDDTRVYSPIAFDLNESGVIEVTGNSTAQHRVDTSVNATVYFDIDADGTLERIEWLAGTGDGFLVDNRDGNAASDMDGARLFGNEGGLYADGYEKLALLDADADGWLSGAELDGLNLWVDDGDAFVESGELQSLQHHGIERISVEAREVFNAAGESLLQSEAVVSAAAHVGGGLAAPIVANTFAAPAAAAEGIRDNGTSGDDVLIGTDQDDRLRGSSGMDTLVAGAGEDRLDGGSGDDVVFAGDDNDHVRGRGGDDILMGEGGDDYIDGGKGTDFLLGGAGNDELEGGKGDDTLYGEEGDDTLEGDDGADTFVFGNGTGNDVVTDFNLGEDRMVFISPIAGADLVVTHNGGDEYVVTWGGADSVTLEVEDNGMAVNAMSLLAGNTGGGAVPAPVPLTPAELNIESFAAVDTTLAAGQDLDLVMTARNDGGVAAAPVTTFYWSADDSFDAGSDHVVGTVGNGNMMGGSRSTSSASVDYATLLGHGDGHIFAVIDAGNAIAESDEGNNVADSIYVDVSSGAGAGNVADLTISNASANLATLTDDDDLIITYDVENIGTADARSETLFYYSADGTLDAGDVLLKTDGNGTMEVGEINDERIKIDYDDLADHAMNGFVIAVVDGNNDVFETNEANNEWVFAYDVI